MKRFLAIIFFLLLLFTVKSKEIFKKSESELKANFTGSLSPVIFIPGDGGSQIDAKLNKPNVVHYICQKHSDDWFNIWLNMELLVPLVIDCWVDNVKLYYDNVTRKTTNSPGVELRVPGWGNPDVVEWIDPSRASTGSYFKDIGNALVNNFSYERGKSIRGAPYDFRKAPNENKEWFIDMKKLIEDTFRQNNNTPVTLITHSMGSPMTLVLLQEQSREWKRHYVKRIISLAGAWAGSVKAVKVFAMGDDLGSLALSGRTMRAEQITSPSLSWLLPSPYFWKDDEIIVETTSRTYSMEQLEQITSPSLSWLLPSPYFWKDDEIIVETTSRTYSMEQLEQYFKDLNYYTGWEMRKDTMKYTLNFNPPDVEIHCLYGSQIDTVERLSYKKDVVTEDQNPSLIPGNGDGTVNIRSLRACEHWREFQKPNITLVEYPKVDHMMILSDKNVINYILKVMSENN